MVGLRTCLTIRTVRIRPFRRRFHPPAAIKATNGPSKLPAPSCNFDSITAFPSAIDDWTAASGLGVAEVVAAVTAMLGWLFSLLSSLESLKIFGRWRLGKLLKFFSRRKREDFRRLPPTTASPLLTEDFFLPSPEDFFLTSLAAFLRSSRTVDFSKWAACAIVTASALRTASACLGIFVLCWTAGGVELSSSATASSQSKLFPQTEAEKNK